VIPNTSRPTCASQSAGSSWFFSQRSVSVFGCRPARRASTDLRREQRQAKQFVDGTLVQTLLARDLDSAGHPALVEQPLPVVGSCQRIEDRFVVLGRFRFRVSGAGITTFRPPLRLMWTGIRS
jgi:hypothetical protein